MADRQALRAGLDGADNQNRQPHVVLLKGGSMNQIERHPGFENYAAALDHYQRRELLLLDLVDKLKLENAHLQTLLAAST
jgi:hypothetical protein